MNENKNISKEPDDAIIIGAGISGIIFLKYAREKGLNCLVLEKQGNTGGLWNWIPAWQDIQNRKLWRCILLQLNDLRIWQISGLPLLAVVHLLSICSIWP